MSKVQTQAEANRLNATGTYGPYLAANGHLMIANLIFPVDGHAVATGATRPYQVGDEIRYTQWDARCADTCRACAAGDPLPDW